MRSIVSSSLLALHRLHLHFYTRSLLSVCAYIYIYIYIYIYARIVFRLDASTDGRAPSSRPSSVVVAYYSTIMNIIISLLPFNFPRFLLFELFRFDDASFLRVSSHHRFSHHVERHVFSTRSIHQCHSISHGFCSNFFAFMTLRFFASLRIAFLMSSASSPPSAAFP